MTDLYRPRPDRLIRFRFTLRTMFVLLTLLGVALGWLGVQVKWIRDRHAALRYLDDQVYIRTEGGVHAPWSLRILGEPGMRTIDLSDQSGPYDQQRLKELFPESEVDWFWFEGPPPLAP